MYCYVSMVQSLGLVVRLTKETSYIIITLEGITISAQHFTYNIIHWELLYMGKLWCEKFLADHTNKSYW